MFDPKIYKDPQLAADLYNKQISERVIGEKVGLADTPVVDEVIPEEKYNRTDTEPTFTPEVAPVIDEEAIRRREEEAIAEQIRAIEGVYAGEISKAQKTGQGRVQQRTAISTVRGGAGSDFASAEKDVVEQANADIITAINQQMAAEIASARSKGGANARQAIQDAYDNAAKKKALAGTYIESEKSKFADAQSKASVLSQSGVEYGSIDPATRELLEKYYGTGAEAVYKKMGETVLESPETQEIGGILYERQDDGTWKAVTEAQKKDPTYSGTVGEYQFYAEQEKQAGRTPMSFSEYQTADANRKNGGTKDTTYKTGFENLTDEELEVTLQGALDDNGDVDTTKLTDKQLIELQRRGYFDETNEETKTYLQKLMSGEDAGILGKISDFTSKLFR
jgi:hypothetical protein